MPPEDVAWLGRSDVDGVDGSLDVLMGAASSVAAGRPHIADGGRSRDDNDPLSPMEMGAELIVEVLDGAHLTWHGFSVVRASNLLACLMRTVGRPSALES